MNDGHIHTPYCPHGSSDSLKSYVEKALQLGYTSMTFTEHAPLPLAFTDPAPDRDSSMSFSTLHDYLEAIENLKVEYSSDLVIRTGLEVDYIENYEEEVTRFLEEYGPHLDDSILSVHFLKGKRNWHCIDFSPEAFRSAVHDLGGMDALYDKYVEQIEKSITADLGEYKPSRIGHVTLVRKFHHLFESPPVWEKRISDLFPLLRDHGMMLDYNGAGSQKEYCRETYPPLSLAEEAHSYGIPLIYGSDAHSAAGLHAGRTAMKENLLHNIY